MVIYSIYFHFIHYKPYEAFRIDCTKENLNRFISVLEKNSNIIIDNIIKNHN